MERFPESISLRVASVVGGIAMLASCGGAGESNCTGREQYDLEKGDLSAITEVEEKVGPEVSSADLERMNPDTDLHRLEPHEPFYGPESCSSNSS